METRGTDDWAQVDLNPHCWEIIQNDPHMNFFVNPVFDRVLREDNCMMPYSRRGDKIKTCLHWGQRKLLLSEIEFLTILGPENLRGSLVVYAGAAPGTHLMYLSSLFPEVEFLLYDPAPFNKEIKKNHMLVTKRQFFTDKKAKKIARKNQHRNVFFISDIRLIDQQEMTDSEIEDVVKLDMARQMQWHRLIGSKRSMLKFRLPWLEDGKTPYLAGDIYLPVWGPQTTTEARLITDPDEPHKIVEYNNKFYEMQMMYFNNVIRHSLFHHEIQGEGLDHCYDCTAEIHILTQYIRQRRRIREDRVPNEVSIMSRVISEKIPGKRTLNSPNPDPAARREGIKKTQRGEEWVLDPESTDSAEDSDREARADEYTRKLTHEPDDFEAETPDSDPEKWEEDRAFQQSSLSGLTHDEPIFDSLHNRCCQPCLSFFD